jgi:hypothetical protein
MLSQTKHCSKIQGISGFSVIRTDRGNRRGEGVAIFVKNTIPFKIIPFPGLSARFDSILMVREQCFSMLKFTI